MTTMIKAIALTVYEILFDTNPFDQARRQEALDILEQTSLAV